MFRATLLAIPGAADDFVFEHTEFTGPAPPSSQPRMQDPGASFLVLNVRDLDAAMAGIKKFGGTIVSTGGQPVGNNGNRAVFARDRMARSSRSSSHRNSRRRAPAVGFEVRDTAAALEVIKASGGSVISAGGKPVEGRNLAFARDPNGVLLEVIQIAPKP